MYFDCMNHSQRFMLFSIIAMDIFIRCLLYAGHYAKYFIFLHFGAREGRKCYGLSGSRNEETKMLRTGIVNILIIQMRKLRLSEKTA